MVLRVWSYEADNGNVSRLRSWSSRLNGTKLAGMGGSAKSLVAGCDIQQGYVGNILIFLYGDILRTFFKNTSIQHAHSSNLIVVLASDINVIRQ